MAFWDAGLAQARQLWGGLSLAQRVVFTAVALGLVVGFTSLAFWVGAPEYTVLYGRLAESDASEVVEKLKADNVPYRLESGGRTVLVPSALVYDLRLQLAGEGIPQGGGVGFEIFDRSGFGMTDFAQKVNYTRALEGELMRTIRRLDGVEGARVHLVLPERRLFEEESEPATASVVLQVGSSRQLTNKQIQGVVYLVASSVEGLRPDRITVVDTRGNVLYQSSGDETGLLATNQLEFKRAYEKDVELRVRQMLERVLGTGAAVVQVSAEFDFDRVEETAETYDPESLAVRSEERVVESSTGAGGPTGVPGVASNVGEGGGGPTGGGGGSSNRETETINYEVSKRVTRIQRSQGGLRRLTVAVAVDGTYPEGGDGGAKEFQPRGAEELAQIRSLVEKAVGSDTNRGDEVEITSIPFRTAEIVEAAGLPGAAQLYLTLAKYGLAVLVALAFLLGVAHPIVRWLTGSGKAPEITEPVTLAEMERQLGEVGAEAYELEEATPSETVKRETLKKRLSEMVAQEPQVAAQLVRSWMTEE